MRSHRVDPPTLEEIPAPEVEPKAADPEPGPDESDESPLRAGRPHAGGKFAAGLRGLKHAIRGDSSFFAHAYRGVLIAMTAALLGVDPLGWCFLVISATLVLLAEITHSAIDALARAQGDPDEPALKIAREIAAAGVLIAAIASGGLTLTVLTVKFGEMFGWWGN